MNKKIKMLLFFSCLLWLGCNTKKQEYKFSYPLNNNTTHRSINLSGEYNIHDVVQKIRSHDITEEHLNNYLPGLKQKKTLVTADSLMPRYWERTNSFSHPHRYNSIHWGKVDENMTREGIDTLYGKNKQVEYATRWESNIKASVLLPERGMIIFLDIPYAFHLNPFKKRYEYFFSKTHGNKCWVSISAPYLGDLNYEWHYIMNLVDDNSMQSGKSFDANGNGVVSIGERRWHYDFENGKNRYFYPLNMMDADFQKKATEENKVINKSSELYQIEFDLSFKTPRLKNFHNANSAIPGPLYFLVVKTNYIGNLFN